MDAAAALAEAGGAARARGRGRAADGGPGPARPHVVVARTAPGLYFSTVVRPPVGPVADGVPSLLGLLTLAAGLAVAEGVGHATGLEASLKWPNDLFYGFKLAGRAGGRARHRHGAASSWSWAWASTCATSST